MQFHENFSLRPYNTFAIDAKARLFNEFSSVEELEEYLMLYSSYPAFILGGGSNVLFTKDYEGVVLKNEIKGNRGRYFRTWEIACYNMGRNLQSQKSKHSIKTISMAQIIYGRK